MVAVSEDLAQGEFAFGRAVLVGGGRDFGELEFLPEGGVRQAAGEGDDLFVLGARKDVAGDGAGEVLDAASEAWGGCLGVHSASYHLRLNNGNICFD